MRPARDRARSHRPDARTQRRWPLILAFLTPALLLYAVFLVYPIVQGARYSLYDWNGFGDLTDFVGFANFTAAFEDDVFRGALAHNVIILVLTLLLQLPFALFLAVLLDQNLRGRTLMRVLFFAPFALSEVVTAVVWRQIFRPDGLLDGAVSSATREPFQGLWIANPDIVLYSVFFVISWKYFGFHMILMLAGLQQIPRDLTEAAAVDGATPWQMFRHITLPLLGPTLRVSAFLAMIGSLQLFDLVWVMTGGGPVDASNTMATYLIDWGYRRSEFGYASAVSVVVFTLSLRRRPGLPALGASSGHRGRHRDGSQVTRRSADPRMAQWVTRAGLYLVAFIVLAMIIIPVAYAVLGGFRDTAQLARDPIGLPSPWIGENYEGVLQSRSFWRQLANSTLIAVLTLLFVLPAASLAAFVIARFSFRGREAVYTLFTLGLLFPIAVAILPLFIVIRQLELLNSPLGVALPQAAFALPLSIVILRPFFASIPREVEEAAILDGASPLRVYWSVFLPLSRPAMSTVAALTLVTSWNAFLLPLLVLTQADSWTLPIGVTNFSTQYTTDTARVLAFTTLAMIPALLFYLVAERQFVKGLTAGATKG